MSLVETPDTAQRKKLSFPRVIGRASDDGRVQDEVDCVYHLGEDGLRARRLRIAEGKPDKAGQRFTQAVCVQGAATSRGTGVHRVEQVHSLRARDLAEDDPVTRHSQSPTDQEMGC